MNSTYKHQKIITLSALIVLWVIFLRHALVSGRSFALFMDNEFMIGTVLSSMSTAFGNGDWPLRMDTILGGIALYNFTQLSVFYPFYFTVLPIFGSPLAVMHSMHYLTLAHTLILEVNLFLFIRVLGASRIAAVFGAVLVAFGANSLTYTPWLNIVAPYAWLPLYLAGLLGMFNCPKSKKYFAMALAGMVLLTLASPAQPLIHAIFLTGIFLCIFGYYRIKKNEIDIVRQIIIRVSLLAILAVLLTAEVIFPAMLEYKNMVRWVGDFPPVVGNDRIPFQAFLTDQLTLGQLGGVLFRFKYQAVGSQYIGLIPIALAGIALSTRGKNWLTIALAFIGLYSLISAAGSNLGLAYINYHIPLLNKIREPSRFLVLFHLAAGALAALGLDELRKIVVQADFRLRIKRVQIALIVVLALAALTMFVAREQIVSRFPPLASMSVLILLVGFTFFAASKKFRGYDTVIVLVWVVSAFLLQTLEVAWLPGQLKQSKYLSSGAMALDMALEKIAKLDPNRQFRVIFDGNIEKQGAAMLASYRSVRTFNAFLCPAPYRQFEDIFYYNSSGDNYYRILGGKYLVCKDCQPQPKLAYQHIDTVAGYEIYETNDVLPKHFISAGFNGTFSSLQDFKTKASAITDLKKGLLFVEPKVANNLGKILINDDGNCIQRENFSHLNHAQFELQCNAPVVFVLNEYFDNAWKATVDGDPIKILKVNGNQVGVLVKAGSHVIDFKYRPVIFSISLALMVVGVLGCCFIFRKQFEQFWDDPTLEPVVF